MKILNWLKWKFYLLFETKEQKADRMLFAKFTKIWEKRIEQRMSDDFDWDTMSHLDDNPRAGWGPLEEVWNRAAEAQQSDDDMHDEIDREVAEIDKIGGMH